MESIQIEVTKRLLQINTLKIQPSKLKPGMPIIGIVENMSGYVCPSCGDKIDIFQSGGGKKMSEETGIKFLGSIPIDPNVGIDSDKGSPFVIEHADSTAAKAFVEIVKEVESYLKTEEKPKA